MKHGSPAIATLLLLLLMGPCSCSKSKETPRDTAQREPTVAVVNYPLQYFAERIGGGVVDVVFPAPLDGDPAFWTPTDADVERYQSADLVFLNGADYAKWTQLVSLSPDRIVETSGSFRDRYIEVKDAVTHTHGPDGDHAHTGTAFTTWLDPRLAIEHGAAIHAAMTQRWPEYAATFDAGFQTLQSDLTALDTAFETAATGYTPLALLASHPVYQYFARRYGLQMQSVTWEPDTVPSPAQWRAFDALRVEHPAKWMIWEGPPTAETTTALRDRGIGVVVIDPCGNRPDRGDYLEVMRQNLAAFTGLGDGLGDGL